MGNGVLKDKVAVVFGAGGTIGAAVAKEFALEGAEVFLAGRTQEKIDEVAKQITAVDGKARGARIDTLDERAVVAYIDRVVKDAGKIDILIDLTGPLAKDYGNGKYALDLPLEEFMTPLETMVKSRFITSRSAARHMVKQGSGVIILVTGSPARGHTPGATAIGTAFGAMETFSENLAFQLGSHSVRVVCLRTQANIDSRSIQDTLDIMAASPHFTKDQAIQIFAQSNFLKTNATVQDTANAAVLIASDRARMLSGTVVNATAGAALD